MGVIKYWNPETQTWEKAQAPNLTEDFYKKSEIDQKFEDLDAADVGAVPQLPVYYNNGESADDILVPFALIQISPSYNPELQAILQGTFAYLYTGFYGSVSTTSRREQIAISYNADPPKMAYRIYGPNGWTAWKELATTDYALARDGSNTMKGTLNIQPNGVNAYSQFYKNATSDESDWGTLLIDRDATNAMYGLKLRAAAKQARITDGVAEHDIYHTGNKPTPNEIGAAPAIQYGTEAVTEGAASSYPDGTLYVVINE